MATSTNHGGRMHIGSTRGSREQRAIGGLVAVLSVILLCCTGCIEEQSMNLSEDVNNSPTDPISRTDAVIVALSHPGVAETIENDSFQISVGELSVQDVREERFKEYYVVHIDRFDITTHEPLEGLLVDVTYDGSVYKVRRLPPPENPSISGVSPSSP